MNSNVIAYKSLVASYRELSEQPVKRFIKIYAKAIFVLDEGFWRRSYKYLSANSAKQ